MVKSPLSAVNTADAQPLTQSLSIRTKLVVGVGIGFVFFFSAALLILSSIQLINSNFTLLAENTLPISLSLQELSYRASRVNSSVNELLVDVSLGDESAEASAETEEIIENVEALGDEIDRYSLLLSQQGLSEAEEFVTIITLGRDFITIAQSIEASSALSVDELIEIREEIEGIEEAFVAQSELLVEQERTQLTLSREAVSGAFDNTLRLFLVMGTLGIIFVILNVRYLYGTISRPLINLTQTALRLRDGDLTARSTLRSSDELGQFALTFNTMAEATQRTIVEAKAARERAEQSDQVKSAFLASMSHELRTPLNSVINYTRFVVDGDTGPVNDQQRDLLTEVVKGAKHLLNLINDVLDMSKIESGSLNLFIQDDVSIEALVKSAVNTGKSLLADKPIQLHTDVAEHLPLVRGDKQRILQIMLNILSNACKFTEEGEIVVRAHQAGDEIIISVKDTGPGIALED